jgi:hypothetical protein
MSLFRLPHPERLIEARDWLRSGAHTAKFPQRSVRTLLDVIAIGFHKEWKHERLPREADVELARIWLKKNAPVAASNALKVVKILIRYVDALPSLVEKYKHGTPAWCKAMGIPQKRSSHG